MKIIGRKDEVKLLRTIEESKFSEFVAIYGRRRIGKTYLVDNLYEDKLISFTGSYGMNDSYHLAEFSKILKYKGDINDWSDAFNMIEFLVSNSDKKKKIIFFDEIAWIDEKEHNFLVNLERFWNTFASKRDDIILIVCASATSWMFEHILNNYGGLYNRVTRRIHLKPFDLVEAKQYCDFIGLNLSNQDIIDAYMIFGGIPYYFYNLQKGYSINQNINALFFKSNSSLKNEYEILFSSLFRLPGNYIKIMDLLSQKNRGLTREELAKQLNVSNGGELTKRLEELDACSFISKYPFYGKKIKGSLYKATDNFVVFYNKMIKSNVQYSEDFWIKEFRSPMVNTFRGYAFERVCLLHTNKIKELLKISAMNTREYYFRNEGCQIDLIIDRPDKCINICEIKYSDGDYELSKDEFQKIENRVDNFKKENVSKRSYLRTLITNMGFKNSDLNNRIDNKIVLEDIFE
jgi:AAA+ ATPase superfamily predicted ATPase